MASSLLFAAGLLALVPNPYAHPLVGQAGVGTTDPARSSSTNTAKKDNLQWAALGDSFASGVTYKHDPSLDWTAPYDPNCRRILDAYSVQLFNQTDWTGNRPQTFNFPACSGAKFEKIEEQAGYISEPGRPAEFVTLTVGGNDAKFAEVARTCMYHPDWKHYYGAPWPDQGGDCFKKLVEVKSIINNARFQDDLQDKALEPLMRIGKAGFDGFQIFLTGYPKFFNVDENSAWCDQDEFDTGVSVTTPYQKLTLDFRNEINGLVDTVNAKHKEVVTRMNDPNIHFVDIDAAYNGHRFCEKPLTGTPRHGDNYDNGDSNGTTWLWNFHNPWFPDIDNGTVPYGYDAEFGPTLEVVDRPNSEGGIPEFVRIMHPTRLGHEAIMKILKDVIAPTMKHSAAPPSGPTAPVCLDGKDYLTEDDCKHKCNGGKCAQEKGLSAKKIPPLFKCSGCA